MDLNFDFVSQYLVGLTWRQRPLVFFWIVNPALLPRSTCPKSPRISLPFARKRQKGYARSLLPVWLLALGFFIIRTSTNLIPSHF